MFQNCTEKVEEVNAASYELRQEDDRGVIRFERRFKGTFLEILELQVSLVSTFRITTLRTTTKF